MSDDAPTDLYAYLHQKLASLHANARLVFVFDPAGRLALSDDLASSGRSWRVLRYHGNDLALRASLTLLQASEARLIWVTGSHRESAADDHELHLSTLVDLLAGADDWFDLSLPGVLKELTGGEVWPVDALAPYAEILARQLQHAVQGYEEWRLHQPPPAVLDANAVRALALHVMQPGAPVSSLLFQHDAPAQALDRYIQLAWGHSWRTEGRNLLREHVQKSSPFAPGSVDPWFQPPVDQLGVFLYLRRFLGQNRVGSIANQLRGLGVLGFDPEPLEPWVDRVLQRWDKDAAWRDQIITNAEAVLRTEDVRRAVGLLPSGSDEHLWSALSRAEAPALLAELSARLLNGQSEARLDAILRLWPDHRPASLAQLPATNYSPATNAITEFCDEAAAILYKLAKPVPHLPDLADLVDWYVAGAYYDLEFACARAWEQARRISDDALARTLQSYADSLCRRSRDYLAEADHVLVQNITQNWGGYAGSPRLATYVLYDFVKRRRLRPSPDRCLWVVVFDGMRWDSWQRLVKPRLLESFEIVQDEKAYLSLLPSWTAIARASLLAGQRPENWRGPEQRFTANQKLLFARFAEIPTGEVERRLQFYSGMEADTSFRQLDQENRYPWNVLVFNVSDDNLHMERGNLVNLNNKIEALLAGILETLTRLIGADDTLVLSSDHGFMELDPADGEVIEEEGRWQREAQGIDNPIRYRYLLGLEHRRGFVVRHRGFRPETFTVAMGRRWFRREGDNRPGDRYAHGGISLAEMVVPGIALRRITEKRIEIELHSLPPRIEIAESAVLELHLELVNKGNQTAAFELEAALNTDARPQVHRAALTPGTTKQLRLAFQPLYQERSVGKAYLWLTLTYQGVDGSWTPPRRTEIPVQIHPRSDVVEIQFAGLDELDALLDD